MSILYIVAIILGALLTTIFLYFTNEMIGFATCLLGGITNIVLDYVLIAPNMLNLGITGAGLATGIGNSVPAVFGLVYFAFYRRGTLYFEKPILKMKILFQSMFNGMSELVSQLSTAVTTLLFNVILLELVGKSGVASISVILYIQMLQTAIYFGYAIGVAPIISYKYGAGDSKGLKKAVPLAELLAFVLSIYCFKKGKMEYSS